MFREERIKDFIETEKLFLVPKGQDLLSLENNKEEKNEENKENSRSEKDISISEGKTSTKNKSIHETSQKNKDKDISLTLSQKTKDNTTYSIGRISQKKTLLEEMQKTFVLCEAVKASAYEKYKAIKAKYPTKSTNAVDIQEIFNKQVRDETIMTPYLKAFLKQKTGNIELKRKIEFKEERRNLAKFFQEQQKEERKIVEVKSVKVFSDLKNEMKYNSPILSEVKEEKRSRDPFRKMKSISMHEKGKEKDMDLFPLKYNIESIMQRKLKRFVPAVKQPMRGFSL